MYFFTEGTIARKEGGGRKTKITPEIRNIVEQQLHLDDETTASQLYILLSGMGHHLNLRTILRCRTSLGRMFRGSAYCQLICEPNKQKRLEFAREHRNDNFANIVFTDECSVQLESHRRQCCRKQGEPAKNKPPLVSTLKMMTSSSVFPQGTSGEGSRVGWHKHEGKNRHLYI